MGQSSIKINIIVKKWKQWREYIQKTGQLESVMGNELGQLLGAVKLKKGEENIQEKGNIELEEKDSSPNI
jgi:hypothetical protein